MTTIQVWTDGKLIDTFEYAPETAVEREMVAVYTQLVETPSTGDLVPFHVRRGSK